jgi:hypothetical protein
MGLSWQQRPLGRNPNGSPRTTSNHSVAFASRAMDAFYEEDERIAGHAADPYRRIDIRRTSRHLVVRDGDHVVAAPFVLYESGFARRWYVPRVDVVDDALHPVEGLKLAQTRA